MKLQLAYGVGKWNDTKILQGKNKHWYIWSFNPYSCAYFIVVEFPQPVPKFNDQLMAYNIKLSVPVDEVVYVLILNQDLRQNCMWTRKYTDVTCYYDYRVGNSRVCVL